MDLEAFLDHLNSGRPVQGGGEAHLFMHGVSQQALRLTAEINSGYHEPAELRARAEALREALNPLCPCDVVETVGEAGGGANPGEALPAWAVALSPAEVLDDFFRRRPVPILGRIHRGKLLLDVRTLLPGDGGEIAAALRAWRGDTL